MISSREQIIEKLKKDCPFLSSKYGLKKIGLFGSFASESQNENSDVDLIVEFKRPIGLEFIELTEHLEALLGKKTDVLTVAGLENIRNPKILQNIKSSIIYV